LARRSTATSWRKTSSSTFFDVVDRPTNHSQPRIRTKIRYSRHNDTRRDHPDRAAISFTQVAAAADFWNPAFSWRKTSSSASGILAQIPPHQHRSQTEQGMHQLAQDRQQTVSDDHP
jgi:hypothetical protein